MTSDLPEVWCVIPDYGPKPLLQRCLASLRRVDYPADRFGPERVIVVSNNPPNVNKLFTAAINEGIRTVLARRRVQPAASDPCLVWLLNNDTIADKQCVRAAAQCFAEMGFEETGIVGSKNLLLENSDRIFWGGSLACYPIGRHKAGNVSKGDLAVRTEEEWATFSAVFLNCALIEAIGLLDVNMRHIFSDADYCFRARAQGFKCFYEPNSIVLHAVGSSHRGKASAELERIKYLDALYFHEKWLGDGLYASLTKYAQKPAIKR